MKSAIVTGIRGMDGSILAEQLLDAGWRVYGMIRRSSNGEDLGNAVSLSGRDNFIVVEGDLCDLPSLQKLVNVARPDHFYNMGAMSHVGSSFNQPIYTASATGLGVLHCLEAIRNSGLHTRFLQASTSELFGGISDKPCTEETPMHPRSPYAIAKCFGFWTTVNYREAYKMFAVNSICFNHEHSRRSPSFVTQKIATAAARIKLGLQKKLFLGNLDAKRDWGWAPNFCDGFRMMLSAAEPDDFVLATGETHSVREFCDASFSHLGLDYKQFVEIDPQFYRPAEVDVLLGDYSKINRVLGWKPTVTFSEIAIRMTDAAMEKLNVS